MAGEDMRRFINPALLPKAMRWQLIIVMIAVLVLASCKPVVVEDIPAAKPAEPAQPPAVQPTNPNVIVESPPEQNMTVPVEQPPEVLPAENESTEPGVYERQPEAPPSIAKFAVIFRKQVKEYKFVYKTDQWFVQGKRAKIIPYNVLENIYRAPFVDAIYIDLENKTAVGVCEGRDSNLRKKCTSMGVLGKQYALPYVQFKIQLPEDWLFDYQNLYMTVADAPKLAIEREVVHLKHQSNTRIVDIYIDPTMGLPVAVIDDNVEYHYDRLSKNSLGFQESMVPK
jgi:hypothetical protein